MRRPTLAIVAAVVACTIIVLAGCGDLLYQRRSAWDNLYRDNNVEDVQAVVNRLPASTTEQHPPNGLKRPVIAAVKLGTPAHLLIHDIASNETIWEREIAEIGSRPLLLGNLVVFVAGRSVHALDLATGSERWRYAMPEGWTFRGADLDEGRVYVTIGKGHLGSVQRREGRLIALDAQSGGELWAHEVPFLLAAPAAMSGLVFVPWDGMNITVLNGGEGREIARLRSLDDVIHFVDARPEGVFYGARGLYRLGMGSAGGRRETASHYRVPMEDVPGDPDFELNGYEIPSLSMRKIRFLWRPGVSGEEGGITIADNTVYLLYFRFVFAFDVESGELRWAYRFSEDVEGAHVVSGGLYLIGRHGVVTFVGANTGEAQWESEIGLRIRSAVFSIGDFQPPELRPVEQPNVRQRLLEVIFDPDNRLLPIRTYALGLLTTIDDPEVTQDLLEVTSRDDVPDQLREAAAQALGGRESGAAFLVDALSVHYDYLSRSRPVPLSIVSRTLTQMEAQEAVPALLEHLMDNETSFNDLREVAAAIVALGDASVVGPLRDFLVRYHRDSAFAENAQPLAVMADGLLQHGHIEERELLTSMAHNTQTVAGLREHITQAFEAIASAERAEEDAAAAAAVQQAQEEAGPSAEEICREQREQHYQLTQDEINQVMRASSAELRECFMQEMERNENVGQIRIVWLLTPEGRGINWDIAPRSPELLTCLIPHLNNIEFPCIRAYRQRARFGINLIRSRPEQPPEPEQPTQPEQPPSAGWGPPPPEATEGDAGVTPDEYPDEYPDELPE
jgi:outer membrane protein assembly factor BamB